MTKKQGNKKARRQAGFTLMELVVVLALFSIVGLVIIDVFLLSMRSQRQVSARQETLADLRYIVETISQKIKSAEIDYSHSYNLDGDEGIDGSEEELHLVDMDGNSFSYYVSSEKVKFLVNGQESDLTNPEEVEVVSFNFFISPKTSPFLDERCNDALLPSGCQPAASFCTVNEPDNEFKAGFCVCEQDLDCLTQHCNKEEWEPDNPDVGICLPFDIQPRVTFVLGLESVAKREQERKRIYLQTTVSSRVYKR